jgi:NifU-like protein
MPCYSGLTKEHFFNPLKLGEISDADAIGKAGSRTCGAAVRFSLRIDGTQRISDAKFKAAGCSYLVACSSFLTEQVQGKTTGEAAAWAQSPERSIIEQFEPAAGKDDCAVLAREALTSAIRHYSDSVRDEWSGDEALICTCFGVSEWTIEQQIQTGGLRTISEITKACNAGAGCRSCYSLIEDILDDCWRTGS